MYSIDIHDATDFHDNLRPVAHEKRLATRTERPNVSEVVVGKNEIAPGARCHIRHRLVDSDCYASAADAASGAANSACRFFPSAK
jgi:hypothetical protein